VLILLDLKLPHMTGFQILKSLRQDETTRLIPVVIFTASQSEQDISHSYQAGANGYIVKPIEYDRFVEVVRDVGSYWLGLNVPPTE
jgi:CheY-like chemotaxis protein